MVLDNPFTSKFGLRQRLALARAMVHKEVDVDETVIKQVRKLDLISSHTREYHECAFSHARIDIGVRT